MLNLDPGKLIVIAVVAIILLGPDKLPQFARQMGGAWRSFNDFRHRMETEVRSNMPDLPPTSEIARLARSPSALLTHLSNLSDDDDDTEAEAEAEVGKEATGDEAPDGSYQPPVAANGSGPGPEHPVVDGSDRGDEAREVRAPATNGRPAVAPQPTEVAVPADPTLN